MRASVSARFNTAPGSSSVGLVTLPGVTSDEAELSTVATQIEELADRITEMAERHRGGDYDDVALRLFEVERSLHSASRNLASALRAF